MKANLIWLCAAIGFKQGSVSGSVQLSSIRCMQDSDDFNSAFIAVLHNSLQPVPLLMWL